MEKNNNQSDDLIEIKTESKIEIDAKKLGKEKTKLSDWQMYQLAISSVAFVIETRKDLLSFALEKQKVGILCFLQFYSPDSSSSDFLLKKNYCYKNFFNGQDPFIRLWKNAHNNSSNCEKNEFIRDWLNKRQIIAKHLHRVFQIMIDYDYYCFTQGSSNLSLHFDALETTGNLNTIIKDFRRDGLNNHIEKKRIASRYQTLSFYDYDYFYKDETPDETAVDFWLAMDRFLEEPYLTRQNLYGENSGLSRDEKEQKRHENANKKNKLRNYVHRIMIVPDELLNDNEKKFRAWVRNSDNQQKFVEIYKKTFNRVSETGLKKIEGDIENQKENVESKLLFCKQEMTVTNPDGKKETKFVYSLKLLEDGKWVEYPEDKYAKYYKVTVYNSQRGGYDTKILDYELNDKEELYEFPNMEYLAYLLHADPKELSEIEKEFVDAFLDRSADGAFSLGVQMHKENVKQYIHDNLITGRENWKLEESNLSAQDIKILNILNDDDRINEFNESVGEIYNADLVKNLWDTSQEELKAKDGINNFDAPTDEPEQYDIAKEMYKTLQICNKKEIEEKNKLPVTITFNYPKFFKGLSVALVVSLLIFLALKFIFDVVALWALIVFPVAQVIIFLVCVFFLRNKFKETTYLHKIEVPIPGDENRLEPKIVKAHERIIEEKESTSQDNNTFKKDDKEHPGN